MTLYPLLLPAASSIRLDARWYDYFPIVIYFGFVIAVGFMAKPLIAARRVLPDRAFDQLISAAFGFRR